MRKEYLDLDEIFQEVKSLVESMKFEKSNISVLSKEVDEYGTNTIEICGGLNGSGNWADYFTDLSNMFSKIKRNGFDVWTIKLENDCLDDIFYLTIGIKREEKDE